MSSELASESLTKVFDAGGAGYTRTTCIKNQKKHAKRARKKRAGIMYQPCVRGTISKIKNPLES